MVGGAEETGPLDEAPPDAGAEDDGSPEAGAPDCDDDPGAPHPASKAPTATKLMAEAKPARWLNGVE
jgi:hypothetical protein